MKHDSPFRLRPPYKPAGDQPRAIAALTEGVLGGQVYQTLLGATGTGKTFTMAQVIAEVGVPTLVISHNKALAAQLYAEFSQFFPENRVEYFVSYYDYYQPEAYNPVKGIYIEKELAINKEIEKLRLSASSALLSGRQDVIVVASVSCIYGLNDPRKFAGYKLRLEQGQHLSRKQVADWLVQRLYKRVDGELESGTFRGKGDTLELALAYGKDAYRLYFFGEELERIEHIFAENGRVIAEVTFVDIFPASLFVTSPEVVDQALVEIAADLEAQVDFFIRQGREEEAERLRSRTQLDMEIIREVGYCSGIENYSRYFDRRQPGQRPYCLLDYFPDRYLMFVDESHVTLPQIRGMWSGDRARKEHLINYGFRLPAALDNRPLDFAEFSSLISQVVFVSATPGDYELGITGGEVVEQIIRPTGLLDPLIEVVPTTGQIDHLLSAIHHRIKNKEQALVITLTKKMAEELTDFLLRHGVSGRYIHADIKTLERVQILEEFNDGGFDVLIGVNLLREGLDFPGVSLVAILDANKEGFLRNKRALLQMVGRAARHVRGMVYMYADSITRESMQPAIEETNRRRQLQQAYNQKHGVVPQPVRKAQNKLSAPPTHPYGGNTSAASSLMVEDNPAIYGSGKELRKQIVILKKQMAGASREMDYLRALQLKGEIAKLQEAIDLREEA